MDWVEIPVEPLLQRLKTHARVHSLPLLFCSCSRSRFRHGAAVGTAHSLPLFVEEGDSLLRSRQGVVPAIRLLSMPGGAEGIAALFARAGHVSEYSAERV
jgi:hypothetical protein